MRRGTQQGLVLLPVVITALLLAALVALMQFETLGDLHRLQASRERERLDYVLAAAMTDAEKRANDASCAAYALPTTSFGADTYAANFSPASGSPVAITATATLANGTTRSVTHQAVAIHDNSARQLLLQPDGLAGMDTYLDQTKPDKNFGADGKLVVQSGKTRTVLAFDLSAVPRTARIVSAQLELFGASSQSQAVTLYALVRGWLEGACPGTGAAGGAGGTAGLTAGTAKTASTTTTLVSGSSGSCTAGVGTTWTSFDGTTAWQSSGGDFGAPVSLSSTVGTTQGFYSWEVGPLVREWLSGVRPNEGIILRGGGSGAADFASSDDSTASHRPRLVINYRCECGTSC